MKQTLNAQMGLFIQSFHIFIAQVGPKNFVLQITLLCPVTQ